MRISDHYTPFEAKTLIVVTNNERARLLRAEEREVEEIETIETPDIVVADRHEEIYEDLDQMKVERLKALYAELSKRLLSLIDHDGYKKIIACVPEVNKQHFKDHMHTDVQKDITELIPKNLCSMDLGNIVRILVEG